MIGDLFREIFYQPLFNALIWLYGSVALEDLGLAIILLTILVRVLLYPLFHKAAKHQRLTQQLQPELQRIRDKHKRDREAQAKAVLELFQTHRINPLTPILLLLAQLPVLLALYLIFISDFTEGLGEILYSFVNRPDELNQTLFGLVRLRERSLPLAVLATITQYFQGKLTFTGGGSQMKFLLYLFPAIALVILISLPAAVGLYWLTSTVFSIMQQVVINRSVNLTKVG